MGVVQVKGGCAMGSTRYGQQRGSKQSGFSWSTCLKARSKPGFMWSECVKRPMRDLVDKAKGKLSGA